MYLPRSLEYYEWNNESNKVKFLIEKKAKPPQNLAEVFCFSSTVFQNVELCITLLLPLSVFSHATQLLSIKESVPPIAL